MLFLQTSLRYLLKHPWQFGLCVLGVALGVAMVVAIDLATTSAGRAFDLATESVTGRSTDQIVGGPTGIDETLYAQLRRETGLRTIAPIVEGYVRAPDLDDRTLQLFGVDPLAEAPFRSYLADPGDSLAEGDQIDLATLLVEPATVVLAAETAERYGLGLGDSLALQIGTRTVDVRIVGLLSPTDDLGRRALDNLLIADIATAQELLGQVGRLSRIDLILRDAAERETVQALLPVGVALESAQARSNALQQMTRAFELNLSALSLLALIVGMFLIYNTMTFSVVQRRGFMGTLRCLGATREQVGGMVLAEAALISLAGSGIGLLLGIGLGRTLVGLVTRTINDLYFVVTVRDIAIDPLVLLKGLLLGIAATLVSAAAPAFEALRVPPRTALRRSSIEQRSRTIAPRSAMAGLLLIAAGVVLLLWRGPWPADSSPALVAAFGGLALIVFGAALTTPLLVMLLMRGLQPLLGRLFGLLGRMAARDVAAALSRTGIAVAALMVAVSVTIGVGTMVGSFRQTVQIWLNQSLIADLYLSAPGIAANRAEGTIDPDLLPRLRNDPQIAAVTALRAVQIDTDLGPITLVSLDGPIERGRSAVRLSAGDPDTAWQAWQNGAIFISQPFAFRSSLGVGDRLSLRTDRGEHSFLIGGVYEDYSSDRGVIRMDAATYRNFWDDPAISSLAIFAAPDVPVDSLLQRLQAETAGAGLLIRSNLALRSATLEVFDRTFAITGVLQLLATIVAFIGILSALLALQLERTRELGVLRVGGLTPRQLWGLVLAQTGLLGLTAGLAAIPLGMVLAIVLVYVINRRSFGWTLDLMVDPLLFAQALLVALIAALLAGIYPALRISRINPAVALREE
jgi:putative ABC transport system permease protein